MTAQAQSAPQPTPSVAGQNWTHSESKNNDICNMQSGTVHASQQPAEPTEPNANQQPCPQLQETQTLHNSNAAPPQASRLSIEQPYNASGEQDMAATAAAAKQKCDAETDSTRTAEQSGALSDASQPSGIGE